MLQQPHPAWRTTSFRSVTASTPSDPESGRGGRRRGRRALRHPGRGRRQPGGPRGARPLPHLLRARPRPHPALAAVPAPRRQVPGVHRPRRRPPPHPPHPRHRGGPGRRRHRPRRSGSTWRSPRRPPLAHDCGHGPGRPRVRGGVLAVRPGGYDHAVYGADVVLAPLNLCVETLDGVRNHSWSRPAPDHARGRGRGLGRPHRLRLPRLRGRASAPASSTPDDLPAEVAEVVGRHRSRARSARSSRAVLETIAETGRVGAARARGRRAGRVPGVQLRAHLPAARVGRPGRPRRRLIASLAAWYIEHPRRDRRHGRGGPRAGSPEAVAAAVRYVSGMTDRFVARTAVERLGWHTDALPRFA